MATPRQRWRLGLARSAAAPAFVGRELADVWDAALDRTALPLLPVGRGPARIVFGAPLPAGMAAERELAELLLGERWPIWKVREALLGTLPAGWSLVSLDDVWLGVPSLPGLVGAADYRIELGEISPAAAVSASRSASETPSDSPAHPARTAATDPASIEAAAWALLHAPRLPRQRAKGGGIVTYDLRPLLIDVRVADAGPPVVVRARTRLHPTLGSGRPEEVAAALADQLGVTMPVASVVRERVLLADEIDRVPVDEA